MNRMSRRYPGPGHWCGLSELAGQHASQHAVYDMFDLLPSPPFSIRTSLPPPTTLACPTPTLSCLPAYAPPPASRALLRSFGSRTSNSLESSQAPYSAPSYEGPPSTTDVTSGQQPPPPQLPTLRVHTGNARDWHDAAGQAGPFPHEPHLQSHKSLPDPHMPRAHQPPPPPHPPPPFQQQAQVHSPMGSQGGAVQPPRPPPPPRPHSGEAQGGAMYGALMRTRGHGGTLPFSSGPSAWGREVTAVAQQQQYGHHPHQYPGSARAHDVHMPPPPPPPRPSHARHRSGSIGTGPTPPTSMSAVPLHASAFGAHQYPPSSFLSSPRASFSSGAGRRSQSPPKARPGSQPAGSGAGLPSGMQSPSR